MLREGEQGNIIADETIWLAQLRHRPRRHRRLDCRALECASTEMADRQKTRSLETQVVRGSFWGIAFRWIVRALGFVNTIVLARLLTPADFGVVAIAMLVVGSIEIFLQNGQALALIRHPAPTPDHYNSAWTVSIILGLALGTLIFLSAPLATAYFHEPRSAAVIHVVAFRTMISGFTNVGVVNLRRDLRYRANFVYNSAPSFVSLMLTVGSAIVLRNYWALVIGIMSQQLATIALSYAIEPVRPRLSLAKAGEIWAFSTWSLIRSIAVYLNEQIDKFVVGGFSGAAVMGRYEIATDISTIPTAEINSPMIAALVPVMAKVQNDRVRRRELYLRVLYWSALICMSTSVGVALVSRDLVDVVLGPKWQDAKPLVPWLSLAFGTLGLSSSVYSVFDTVGRPNVSARLQWTRLIGLAAFIAPVGFIFHSVEAIAMTRLVVTLLVTPALFFALAKELDFHASDFAATLWRPLLAVASMSAAVLGLNTLAAASGPVRLAIDVSAGAAVFVMTIMATWLASGRPDGPETILWRLTRRIVAGVKPTASAEADRALAGQPVSTSLRGGITLQNDLRE